MGNHVESNKFLLKLLKYFRLERKIGKFQYS